ncbi:MAG TPA: PQQ-binding-like beta-propeller repeat protein [Iamia sp.]|nr:PQQ-binding-like beta-propeller repeat protein [Iamia sp.]
MPAPIPCTRCGLPLPEAEGPLVCGLCGQVHDATPGRPPGAGWVVLVAVAVPLVVVLVVVGLVLRGGDDEATAGGDDLRPTTGDLLVLPGDLAADPTVVTLATTPGAEGRVVALVALADGPVWTAPVVPDDVYSAQFAVTDDVVLASLGRTVVGLDRGTGTVLWEGEASDEVHPFCVDCFVVVDDTLVVVGNDGEVTAFDPPSGEVLWSHRFASPGGRVLPLGNAVLLVDDGPEDDVTAALTLTLVRPGDGETLARLTPGCVEGVIPGSERSISASPRNPIVPVPGTDDVVLVYGNVVSCVQRWDVTTGEQRWSRSLPDVHLDAHDVEDRAWAVNDTRLVLAGRAEWVVVGLAEGGARVVPAPVDTAPSAMVALAGDRFVAAVGSTRGTTEWSLVGHDLGDGAPLWEVPLGPDAVPAVVGPESSAADVAGDVLFAVVPGGDGLRLLTVGPPGPGITVRAIDPDAGEGEEVGTTAIGTDRPDLVRARVDTVRDGRAVVEAGDALHVVDLATGTVDVTWGRS